MTELKALSIYSQHLEYNINDVKFFRKLQVNKALCDECKIYDFEQEDQKNDENSNLGIDTSKYSYAVIIKLKTFENLEKYNECLSTILDMLFIQFKKDRGMVKTIQKPIEPEINESNQFQILHLFALFGLNYKKQKLTDYIQSNITSKNLFNYLLWISDYIQAWLHDAYIDEIKYWYWLIVYILLKKHTNENQYLLANSGTLTQTTIPLSAMKFTTSIQKVA